MFFPSLINDDLSRLVQDNLFIKLAYINATGHDHVRIRIIEMNTCCHVPVVHFNPTMISQL